MKKVFILLTALLCTKAYTQIAVDIMNKVKVTTLLPLNSNRILLVDNNGNLFFTIDNMMNNDGSLLNVTPNSNFSAPNTIFRDIPQKDSRRVLVVDANGAIGYQDVSTLSHDGTPISVDKLGLQAKGVILGANFVNSKGVAISDINKNQYQILTFDSNGVIGKRGIFNTSTPINDYAANSHYFVSTHHDPGNGINMMVDYQGKLQGLYSGGDSKYNIISIYPDITLDNATSGNNGPINLSADYPISTTGFYAIDALDGKTKHIDAEVLYYRTINTDQYVRFNAEIRVTDENGNPTSYNMPKLDFGQSKYLGSINIFHKNILKRTLKIYVFGGIPDKSFNDPDHRFIYRPFINPVSKQVSLSMNLGSEYTNYSKKDIIYYAQSSECLECWNYSPNYTYKYDFFTGNSSSSYGSSGIRYSNSYNWGRKPDGHEIMGIDNTYHSYVHKYGISNLQSTTDPVPHNKFIFPDCISNGSNGGCTYAFTNWLNQDNKNLWLNSSSANNPCPSGYHVSTPAELDNEWNAAQITTGNSVVANLYLTKWAEYYTNTAEGSSNAITRELLLTSQCSSCTNVKGEIAFIPRSRPRTFGQTVKCFKD